MSSPAVQPGSDGFSGAESTRKLNVVNPHADPDFQVREPKEIVTVVGINPGGFPDLGRSAQDAICTAELIIGSRRQLDLLPIDIAAETIPWPSPLVPAIPRLFADWRTRDIVVLASGDPMFHGIGTTLARELGAENLRVIPAPSCVALACAELKWPAQDVKVVSLVTQEESAIVLALDAGEPFLILGKDRHTPLLVQELLLQHGHADAEVSILSDLGGPHMRRTDCIASSIVEPDSSLNVIAISPATSAPRRSLAPGLPDSSYDNDGQLTKQHIRALTVAALEPAPGKLLWDIGGGSGSIGIEYLRLAPSSRAISFEQSELRQARIRHNATMLGTPSLEIAGAFPSTSAGKARPDVIFIGGGLTAAGVFDAAWEALIDGGLLIANAVTLESQIMLHELRKTIGGTLTRIEIGSEHSVGNFTALKPALPVWQWKVRKTKTTGSI